MARYLPDDGSMKKVFNKLKKKHFKNLNAKIKFIFDTKKRTRNNQLVLGTCKLANDMLKFLTESEIEEGYDYFIIIDHKAWEIASLEDRERILRHELRHIFIDEKGNYKLAPHDIEDFVVEIELNKDKPNWRSELAFITDAAYDQGSRE